MVKALIALCAFSALIGCASPKAGFCAVSSPMRPSAATIAAMSDAEVKDVLAHNRLGQKLCGWKP